MTRITVCVAVFTIGTTLCGASQVDDDAVSKYILSNLAAHPQVRSDGVVQRKVLSIDRIYEWSGGHKRRDFIVYAVVQVTVRESGHTQTWYETPSYRVPDGTTALTPATTAYSYSVDEARYRKGITESDGHKLFRIVYPKSLRQAPPPSKTTSPEPNPKAPAPAPDVSTPRVSLVTVYAAPALRGPARSWEKLSTREVYKGDVIAVRVRTRPREARVHLEVTDPRGGHPIRTVLSDRDGDCHTYQFMPRWEGKYTVRVTASNAAGRSRPKEKQIEYHDFPRDERKARLKIRVRPSKVHAGEEITVSATCEPQGLEVTYDVGRPDSPVSTRVGTSKGTTFTFNTTQARSELRSSDKYVVRAGVKTPGGRFLTDEDSFRYVHNPKLGMEPRFPADGVVGLPELGEGVLSFVVTNDSHVNFEGRLTLSGPNGVDFLLDGRDVGRTGRGVSFSVARESEKIVEITCRTTGSYKRAQIPDQMSRALQVVGNSRLPTSIYSSVPSPHITAGIVGDDRMTASLVGDDGKTVVDLDFALVSTGERQTGRLAVSVQVNPRMGTELRTLKPNTQYMACFDVHNAGQTLIFLNDIKLEWPKVVRPVSRGKILRRPKPWKSVQHVDTVAADLLSALEDITSTAKGPLVSAMADAYMSRYFVRFLEISDIGVPVPPGERLTFTMPFQTSGGGTGPIAIAATYHDTGKDPPCDFGTGYWTAAQAVIKFHNELLPRDYTPVARPVASRADIRIQPPPFGDDIDRIAGPLIDEGYRLQHSLNSGIGVIARMKCPAELHVYDDKGRHVGINAGTGQYENNIPGAQHVAIGEADYVYLPTSLGNCRIVTRGRETGTYDLDVVRPAVVRHLDGSIERVLVPFQYCSVATRSGQQQFHDQDVAAIAKVASSKLGETDLETALREALREIGPPPEKANAPLAWDLVVLYAALAVALASFAGWFILRRRRHA